MTDATGRLVAQRYRLVQVIGSGGMGRVWLGHDELIGREVAIKELLLPPGLEDEQRMMLCQRAMREAQAAGRLSHPGIVTVHDVVEYNNSPMIVMELVRGGSLDDIIKSQGGLPVERVARIGMAILDALRVAHQAGIVHRDLKPANVLLSGDRVVITDFGIARLMGDVQLTSSGVIVGTPAYMAPEQGTGAPVTPASDLWSLGATLYAALEGRPPFEGPDFVTTLAALLTKDPLPPQRAGRLTGLVNALLRKDPTERATVEQVADLLVGGDTGGNTEKFQAAGYQGPLPAAKLPSNGPKAGTRRRTMLLAGGGALAAIGVSSIWLLNKDPDGESPTPGNTANSNVPSPNGTPAKNGTGQQSGAVEQSAPAVPGKPVEITDHIQLTGHPQPVTSVVFSPDGKLLASGDGDLSYEGPTARLWDTTNGKLLATLVGPPGTGGASAVAVAFSPDGKLLAVGGNFLGDSTRLWNVADRQVIGPLTQSRSIMKSLAFSPDGRTVAGVTTRGEVKVWDVASRQVKVGLPDGDGFRNVMFSPDGTLLAYPGKQTEIRLADPATGRTVRTINGATSDGMSFSPDGKTLAAVAAGGDHSFGLWDVSTGQSTASFERTRDLTLQSVLFSPDGKTIAAWGLGNIVQLWDVAARRVRAVLVGSSGDVNTAAFDPTGPRIATAGGDLTIRIWNLAR